MKNLEWLSTQNNDDRQPDRAAKWMPLIGRGSIFDLLKSTPMNLKERRGAILHYGRFAELKDQVDAEYESLFGPV